MERTSLVSGVGGGVAAATRTRSDHLPLTPASDQDTDDITPSRVPDQNVGNANRSDTHRLHRDVCKSLAATNSRNNTIANNNIEFQLLLTKPSGTASYPQIPAMLFDLRITKQQR